MRELEKGRERGIRQQNGGSKHLCDAAKQRTIQKWRKRRNEWGKRNCISSANWGGCHKWKLSMAPKGKRRQQEAEKVVAMNKMGEMGKEEGRGREEDIAGQRRRTRGGNPRFSPLFGSLALTFWVIWLIIVVFAPMGSRAPSHGTFRVGGSFCIRCWIFWEEGLKNWKMHGNAAIWRN
jgi:hypothetical protein